VINVSKLRTRVEEKIAADKLQHEKQLESWNAFLVEHKAEWNEKWGKAWLAACVTISRVVSDGGVVTRNMLPQHGYSESTYGVPYEDGKGNRKPAPKFLVPQEVQQLLDGLDLLGEDEISLTALGKAGVGTSVMTTVSRYLSGDR
jgi:hypothetical protein